MLVGDDKGYVPNKNLLILNYATDEKNQVFAHQIEVVRHFSDKFQKVYVITASKGSDPLPENVELIESKWIQGQHVTNSIRLISKFMRIYIQDRNIVVFSHMTEVQSALISPLTKIARIKHIVWYAHASRSLAMSINQFLLDLIVTSTAGSCPYTGKKVKIVGQAIDDKLFKYFNRNKTAKNKFVHIGRTDPSKKIEKLIQAVENLNDGGFDSTLAIVGKPSTPLFNSYRESLIISRDKLKDPSRVIFCEPVERKFLPEYLNYFDFFIHAFEGSLDKTLVEATLCGIPVLTLNQEYRSNFGQWSKIANSSIEEEFLALIGLNHEYLTSELKRRRKIAVDQHSLSGWVEKITMLLTD